MKIDCFNHIITPRYHKRRLEIAPPVMRLQDVERTMPTLFDLEARLRVMDTAGHGYVQIINTANPPVESMAGAEDALELSRIANDEMAELVARFPDRFVGAAACLPMNNIQGALDELDRAVGNLGSAVSRSIPKSTDVHWTTRISPRSSTGSPRSTFRSCCIPDGAPTGPTIRSKTPAASIRGGSSAGFSTRWRQ